MPRFNSKQDLSKLQLMERAKRKQNSCRGLQQPKGTKPIQYTPSEKAAFIPMPKLPSYTEILAKLLGRKRK